MVGIWKRAHIAKPVYPQPTHDNGWQCVDGMIELPLLENRDKYTWYTQYFHISVSFFNK
jgi:hypothetical protein